MVAFNENDPPPQDLNAERHLLGALLQDPERTLSSAKGVGISVEDFYDTRHADIWGTALSLHARGTVPDPVALRGHYEDRKGAEVLEVLRGLAADLPTNLYPFAWAERVREKGARRGLFYFGRKVASLGQNGRPASESIEEARVDLDFLRECFKPAEDRFGWTTGAALLEEPEEDESAHLWPRVVVPGALTLLAGAPKAGKSWILYAFAGEVTRGGEWAGRALGEPRQVVILSEESRRTIRRKVKRFGVEGATIMPRSGVASSADWPAICAAAGEKCRAVGAGLLIIDTFSHWADLGPDDEQKEGPIRRALRPAQAVADTGVAVVVSHHLGKNGTVRGSTALRQVPDVLVEVRPFEEPERPERSLSVVGRFEDNAGELVVRYVPMAQGPDRYEFVGSARNARAVARCEDVCRWLLEEHRWASGGEVAKGIGGRRADVLGALALLAGSRIQKVGRGNTTRYAALDVPLETPTS